MVVLSVLCANSRPHFGHAQVVAFPLCSNPPWIFAAFFLSSMSIEDIKPESSMSLSLQPTFTNTSYNDSWAEDTRESEKVGSIREKTSTRSSCWASVSCVCLWTSHNKTSDQILG